MPKLSRLSRKQMNDLIDGLYGMAILISIWVYLKTMNFKTAVIAFTISIILMIVIIRINKQIKQNGLMKSGMDVIDNMTGEELLYSCFKNMGYEVTLTPLTVDYGADLLLNKDGRKIVVQAKRWKGSVGI